MFTVDIPDLMRQNTLLRQELAQVQKKYQSLLEASDTERNEFSEHICSSRKEYAALLQENGSLRAQVDQLTSENRALRDQVEQLRNENRELRYKMEALQEEIECLQSENRSMKQQSDSLNIKMDSIHREYQQKFAQLESRQQRQHSQLLLGSFAFNMISAIIEYVFLAEARKMKQSLHSMGAIAAAPKTAEQQRRFETISARWETEWEDDLETLKRGRLDLAHPTSPDMDNEDRVATPQELEEILEKVYNSKKYGAMRERMSRAIQWHDANCRAQHRSLLV
jgi:chromosome segregation ATPase